MSNQLDAFPLLKIYKEDNGKVVSTHCDERQLAQLKEMGWSMTEPKISGPPEMPTPKALTDLESSKSAKK